MKIKKRMAVLLLGGLAILIFSSCAMDLGYYTQCVQGHFDVMARRKPIDRVLADPAAAPDLKEKLALVLRIREFASRELLLPDNGSYRCYADLQRPEVVWNVVATPEFSLSPRQWCFPVAGCVSYRGYYNKDGAEALAENLIREGEDVHLYGVDAYSTLGWFDDPVLNTFVGHSEARIAGMIFHELAHQKLYVKDDSSFNEAFAEAVELEGVTRWLRREGKEKELTTWLQSGRREEEFVSLLREARRRLEAVYASAGTPAEKRADKARVLSDLQQAYLRLKIRWGGYGGYDRWFDSPINNARLASIGTYRSNLPAFKALLQKKGADLASFYEEARLLGQLPLAERDAAMHDLDAASREDGPADIALLWEASPGS